MSADKKITLDEAAAKGLLSMDVAEEKREQLKQLFPEVFTEDKIDFDQLRRVMGDWVEPGKERYGLNWPGKADCMKVIQAPSIATLKPARDESADFDDTDNLFVEGDNLEVLKLLQKAYFGKIKMIYIDPPYNTGNEFVYPDRFKEGIETYLAYTKQIDTEGKKFSTNTETSGRYHANWLNMMYPRLYLARNLLRDDGLIFVSIDDFEYQRLKEICDELFGAKNFICNFVWEKSRKNDAKLVSVGHEYILLYAKDKELFTERKTIWREEKPGSREIWEKYLELRKTHGKRNDLIQDELGQWFSSLSKGHPSKKWSRYKRVDDNGPWRDYDISWPGGGGPRYDVPHPKSGLPCKVPERGWVFGEYATMKKMIDRGVVEFREDHTEPPFRKLHLKPLDCEESDKGDEENHSDNADDDLATQVRGSYFYKQSQVAIRFLRELMDGKVFDNPKDHLELARLINYVCPDDENYIVLDFFAGSASFAHATFEANRTRTNPCNFICVQLPEECTENSAAYKAGYKTIADLSKERIRRAARQISEGNAGELDLENKGEVDLGFKVFKLDPSNFSIWEGNADEIEDLAQQLELHVNHIDQASGPEDILYELLLKAGFELTTKVKKQTMAGKDVYAVAEGALLICLDKEVTAELIDAIADADPLQVICLDEGFKGNDQLKTNAVQTFKSRAKEDEEAIVFRTV